MDGQALDVTSGPLFSPPGALMTAPRAVSQPCVSVSTTETTGPNSETRVPAIGHQYAVREAINTLIEFGFTVGCDGELLPPRWIRVQR